MPNLKKVNESGFSSCLNLVKLILPKLKKVNGFSYCNSIIEIDLPSLEETGGFRCCKNICSLILPKLTKLNRAAFRSCPNLRSITLNNVMSMDVECFSGCKLDKLELPLIKLISLYTNDFYNENTNLARITEFIIPKVDVSYKIFTEINVN